MDWACTIAARLMIVDQKKNSNKRSIILEKVALTIRRGHRSQFSPYILSVFNISNLLNLILYFNGCVFYETYSLHLTNRS